MVPAISSFAQETIADLGNSDKPLRRSRLVDLSNLNAEELGLFQQVWVKIELKRRRQIIYRLIELAEDNFELSFDSIFKYCLKDQDAEVRSRAIKGLWDSEDASLISPFIQLLEQDSSENVQTAVATALGKFAMLAELKKLRSCQGDKVCQALLGVIGDKSRSLEVRRRALEAAAPLNLSEVAATIREAYQGGNRQLKISAIYAMGKNCHRSWLPILIKELTSVDAEIRYEATAACGELEDEEVIPHLIALISDQDVDVQVAALQALGRIGGNEAKECLEQCLNDPSEVINEAAEQALEELEAEESPFTFRV